MSPHDAVHAVYLLAGLLTFFCVAPARWLAPVKNEVRPPSKRHGG